MPDDTPQTTERMVEMTAREFHLKIFAAFVVGIYFGGFLLWL